MNLIPEWIFSSPFGIRKITGVNRLNRENIFNIWNYPETSHPNCEIHRHFVTGRTKFSRIEFLINSNTYTTVNSVHASHT